MRMFIIKKKKKKRESVTILYNEKYLGRRYYILNDFQLGDGGYRRAGDLKKNRIIVGDIPFESI